MVEKSQVPEIVFSLRYEYKIIKIVDKMINNNLIYNISYIFYL